MGYSQAASMRDMLPLREAVAWHLAHNCYPPVPAVMIEPAMAAVEAAEAGDYQASVPLPPGVTFKDGRRTVPVWQVVRSLRLEGLLTDTEAEPIPSGHRRWGDE
jgi:hypothetical protein